MSIVTTTVIGNTILFRASFLDEDGGAMSPTTVRIRVVQRKVTVDADMEVDGSEFIYRVDTGRFRAGEIEWAIDATDGVSKVASAGTVTLTANQAHAL